MTEETAWTKWKWSEDKHFPKTLSTNVIVKHRDGHVSGVFPVGNFHSKDYSDWHDNGNPSDIVEYQEVTEN